MINKGIQFGLIFTFFFSARQGLSQKINTPPIDYLNPSGPIIFEDSSYHLAWSSHPGGYTFLQEYTTPNETIEHYNKMLLIQAIEDSGQIARLLSVEVALLEKRKKTDQVTNYRVLNNHDKSEYFLDFVVSEGREELTLVEWNAYRYRYFKDPNGRKGIVLFGVSLREYANPLEFLGNLGEIRKKEMAALAKTPFPAITLP